MALAPFLSVKIMDNFLPDSWAEFGFAGVAVMALLMIAIQSARGKLITEKRSNKLLADQTVQHDKMIAMYDAQVVTLRAANDKLEETCGTAVDNASRLLEQNRELVRIGEATTTSFLAFREAVERERTERRNSAGQG